MSTKRVLAKPIYEASRTEVVVAKPLPVCAPMDIVIGENNSDDDDSSIEDVTLNISDGETVKTENDYWTFISTFKWCDKSALRGSTTFNSLMSNVSTLTKDLGTASKTSVTKFNKMFVTKLEETFAQKNVLSKLERTLTTVEARSLAAHIVFRGKNFYETIISDIFFVGYLVGKTPESDEFPPIGARILL